MIKDIKEIFECVSGNQGIYEEFIYQHLQTEGNEYKVLSSALNEANQMGFIRLTEDDEMEYHLFRNKCGIHVTRKGKAGSMNLLIPFNYIPNEVAYILHLKDDFKLQYHIDTDKKERGFLEWFIYKYQNYVFSFASNTDNSTWNKTGFFKEGKIEINFEKLQNDLILLKRINVIKTTISKILDKVNNLKNKELILDINSETKPLFHFLDYISRNDCLSEEGIYSLQAGFKNSIETITIMSGSSKAEIYGYVPINNELHYIYNRPCLLCVTRGNAGKLLFLPKGIYATNTNAMLLYIREDKLAELNIKNNTEEENYLRFLKFNLESKFIQFSSNSDLSVFPMSVEIKDIEFCFNKYNQDVEIIANLDKSLEFITEKINLLYSKIEKIN